MSGVASPAAPELFGPRASLARVGAVSVRGGAAIFGVSVANRVIRFAATLLLARILTPADFGVFAVVMAFAGVAGLLYELGLASATVQRASLTPPQVSTLFWINLGCAAAVAAVGVAGAPWLGRLYGDARIETMCRLIAFSPLLGALGLQHLALMQRALLFRRTAAIGLVSTTLGTIATLLLAWQGSAFVALAAGVLVTKAASAALAWRASGWRPGPPRFDPAVREMLLFSAQLVAFGLLSTIAGGLHSALLGLLAGVESAGLYHRASALLQLFQGLALGALTAVATASLSHLKDRLDDFRHYYLRCALLLTALCAPAAGLGWLFAGDIMRLAFGPQWDASAPLFAIMCAGLVFYVLSYSTGWIYVARGEAGRMMRWGLLGWTGVIIGTLVGLPLGLEGLALAQTVTIVLLFVPCMGYAFAGTGLTLAALGRSVWRPLAAAAAATAAVALARDALPAAAVPRLLLGGGGFALAYLLILSEVLGQRAELVRFARELAGRVAHPAPTP